MTEQWPCLYLLHFDRPHHHAQHYLGSTVELTRRLIDHANGNGARLTEVLMECDEHWTLAALFIPRPGLPTSIRELERNAKRRHSSRSYCPKCNTNHISPPGTVQYPTLAKSAQDLRSV